MEAEASTPVPPRDPIEFLLGDPWFTPTTQVVAWWLWHKGGHQAHERITSTLSIESLCHRDRRNVRRSIVELLDSGILELGDHRWNKQTGAIHYIMWFPARGQGEKKPDPQRQLPFITSDLEADTIEIMSPGPGDPKSSSGSLPDSIASGPAPDSTSSPVSGDSHVSTFSRAGSLMAEPAREGEIRTPHRMSADNFAQKCPRSSDEGADIFAQNCPRPRARASNGPKKERARISPMVQGIQSTKCFGAPAADNFAQNCPHQETEPATIGELAPEVVGLLSVERSPQERQKRKERWERYILEIVGEAEGWWVAGAAADLIVIHGYDPKALTELLNQLQRRIHLPANHQAHIFNPGGWLQKRLRGVAEEIGMQWGKAR